MKINSWLFLPCQVRWLLVTTLGLTISPLWFTTAAWGQVTDGLPEYVTQAEASPADIPRTELTVPQGNGELITDIQIRLVDAGEDTESSPDVAGIIKEFQLQPGDSYDPELAHGDLLWVSRMAERVTLTLEPATESEQTEQIGRAHV